jgi:hypothetical protein
MIIIGLFYSYNYFFASIPSIICFIHAAVTIGYYYQLQGCKKKSDDNIPYLVLIFQNYYAISIIFLSLPLIFYGAEYIERETLWRAWKENQVSLSGILK